MVAACLPELHSGREVELATFLLATLLDRAFPFRARAMILLLTAHCHLKLHCILESHKPLPSPREAIFLQRLVFDTSRSAAFSHQPSNCCCCFSSSCCSCILFSLPSTTLAGSTPHRFTSFLPKLCLDHLLNHECSPCHGRWSKSFASIAWPQTCSKFDVPRIVMKRNIG